MKNGPSLPYSLCVKDTSLFLILSISVVFTSIFLKTSLVIRSAHGILSIRLKKNIYVASNLLSITEEIVQNLKKKRTIVLSYFYFDFRNKKRNVCSRCIVIIEKWHHHKASVCLENVNPKPGFGLYCFDINKKSNLFVKLLIKCIYLGSLFASVFTYSYWV